MKRLLLLIIDWLLRLLYIVVGVALVALFLIPYVGTVFFGIGWFIAKIGGGFFYAIESAMYFLMRDGTFEGNFYLWYIPVVVIILIFFIVVWCMEWYTNIKNRTL